MQPYFRDWQVLQKSLDYLVGSLVVKESHDEFCFRKINQFGSDMWGRRRIWKHSQHDGKWDTVGAGRVGKLESNFKGRNTIW